MKLFDKKYFDTYYSDYKKQNPGHKLIYYCNFLQKYVAKGRLLDIGCSYGMFVKTASSYYNTFGMDTDPEIVAEAAVRSKQTHFVVGKLPEIPLSGLDVITVLDVLEHVPDLDRIMRHLHGALNNSGIALIVVPVYDGPLGWLVRILDHDHTHIHKQSRKFWINAVEPYFELVEWQGIFRKLILGMYYLHIPTTGLRAIAPAIAMILRKKL